MNIHFLLQISWLFSYGRVKRVYSSGKGPEDSPEDKGDFESQHGELQQLRHGEQICTVTEKGKAMQEEQMKGLQRKFVYIYKKKMENTLNSLSNH